MGAFYLFKPEVCERSLLPELARNGVWDDFCCLHGMFVSLWTNFGVCFAVDGVVWIRISLAILGGSS